MDLNLGLYCNYNKCLVSLKNMIWITSCSHVFCDEHTPASKDSKICSICSTDLNERNAIINKNLNPTETEKGLLLAGLNPTTILEIGSGAMAFLKFQSFQEKLILQSLNKYLKRRLAHAESRIEAMSIKLEKQTQQEAQKYHNLQNQNRAITEKLKQVQEENETKKRQLLNCYDQMMSQKSSTSISQRKPHNFNQ